VSPAKLATARGARSAFVVALILAYVLGTAVLQVGDQSGGALTVAGLATLLANALPIVAAATVLDAMAEWAAVLSEAGRTLSRERGFVWPETGCG
jgi:hypothetical protein